jgi:hypothetical protein
MLNILVDGQGHQKNYCFEVTNDLRLGQIICPVAGSCEQSKLSFP